MGNSLTAEQKQALDLSKHIALNANAGSGKTSILVERYLKILDEFIKSKDGSLSPKNVLAITFTNKAASEMQSRVIAKFHEKYEHLLYSHPTNASSLISSQYVREFRDKLISARISTIHSFCLEIITRYPVESGIPINFREISQAERYALIEQAFNTIIDKWLSNGHTDNHSKRKLLSEILVQIDIQDLKEITSLILANNHLVEHLTDYYNRGFTENSSIMYEFIKNTYLETGFNFFKLVTNTFKTEANIDGLSHLSFDLENYQKNINSASFKILTNNEFWKKIKSSFSSIFTQKNRLKKSLEKKLSQNASSTINEAAEYSRAFIEFINDLLNYHSFVDSNFNDKPQLWLEEKYFELCRNIFHFVLDVYEEFQSIKYDEGLLDFNDMLLFAYYLLLNNPDIVEELLSEIKYILVDEFQDTDELQYRIVKMLVPDLNLTILGGPSPNLFVVGDSKQSIYSFRNADVRIFERIKSEISNANKSLENLNSNDGILKLSYTFRLHPEISVFIDKIFSWLMIKNEYTPLTDFHVPYERFIIPAKKFQSYVKSTPKEDRSKNPRVKFLLYLEEDDTMFDDNDEINEEKPLAKNVVRHIQHIVGNEDYKIYDKESQSERCITYSDIAIISRKIKDLASLLSVLSSARIPFIFHGVRNFFATTEIADFIAFLKFLLNPNDDIAFAGILRSIFFGFPDEWLLNIATVSDEKDLSFWKKFHLLIEKIESNEIQMEDEFQKEDLLSQLKETENILTKLLNSYPSLPLNEVIQQIINQTDWVSKVRRKQNYEQILANVDELLDYARDFIGLGFRTINDFIEQIEYANQHGITEGDRYGIVATNAIRLLTIHSAKGLEFPVVYVYQIDSKARGRANFFLSKEFGLAFPMKIYSSERKFSVKTLQYYIAKYHAKAEIDAEEVRLLYVALTRASEYLIITGSGKVKGNLDNNHKEKNARRKNLDEVDVFGPQDDYNISPKFMFSGWLEQIIKMINARENLNLNFNAKIPFSYEIQIGDEETHNLSMEKFDFYLDWIVNPSFLQIKGQIPTKETIEKPPPEFLLLEKFNVPLSGILISPTKILTYVQDTRLYLKRYFLGIPDELSRLEQSVLAEDFDSTDHLILSSIIGSAVHHCLQNIGLWHYSSKYDYNKLQTLVSDYLFANERLKETEIQQIIIEQCLNVIQTVLFKNNVELILNSPKEYEVILPFSDNFLLGKIDLLLTKPNQEREIWDWKTNNISNKEKMIELAKNYEYQMLTYAFLLSKCFPDQSEWTARLLFTKLAKNSFQDEDWTYSFKWTKGELENYADQIDDLQKKFVNLVF